jgi:uracil phosphoribosyltransferase
MVFCGGCGAQNPDAAKFCTSCGGRFEIVTAIEELQKPAMLAVPIVPAATPMVPSAMPMVPAATPMVAITPPPDQNQMMMMQMLMQQQQQLQQQNAVLMQAAARSVSICLLATFETQRAY